MKQFFTLIFLLSILYSHAQVKEIHIQGQVVDLHNNPVSDTYIFNERNSVKSVSTQSGIFDVFVLPGDSIIISHISFLRKVVTVHQLLVDPVVRLELDTINIKPVNISVRNRSDYEKAMKNMERIEFDFRPQPGDAYTETERMKNLLKTENEVERAASYSLNFLTFSPSEEIGKLINKRKKRKEAKQFSSTKEGKGEEEK